MDMLKQLLIKKNGENIDGISKVSEIKADFEEALKIETDPVDVVINLLGKTLTLENHEVAFILPLLEKLEQTRTAETKEFQQSVLAVLKNNDIGELLYRMEKIIGG